MDPVSLLLGLVVIVGVLTTASRSLVDTSSAAKAASAGQWATLEKIQGRRWGQRFADAFEGRHKARHKQAGGNDGDFRPGAKAYFNDLYHAFWERRLEVAKAKRDAREPYVYDPSRRGRYWRALVDKVNQLRAKVGRPPVDKVSERGTEGSKRQPVSLAKAGSAKAGRKGSPPAGRTAVLNEEKTSMPGSSAAIAVDTEEISTNAAMRRSLEAAEILGRELLDAVQGIEAARRRVVAAASTASDLINAARFDRTAVAAASSIADEVSTETLAEWAELADAVIEAARAGYQALDKYLDAESLVAENAVDASTLAASSA